MSLHSHIPEIEERLVGVPKILEKKVEALRLLTQARARGFFKDGVSLNPVLCRLNAPSMEDYVRFFKARGIHDIRFNFIWPESRVQNDKTVVPRFKDVGSPPKKPNERAPSLKRASISAFMRLGSAHGS